VFSLYRLWIAAHEGKCAAEKDAEYKAAAAP
jgi:hypothetical protein